MKSVFGTPPPLPRIYGVPDPLTVTTLNVTGELEAEGAVFRKDPIEYYRVNPATEFETTSFTVTAAQAVKGMIYLDLSGNITITLPSREEWGALFTEPYSGHASFHVKQINTTNRNVTYAIGANTQVVDLRSTNNQKIATVEVYYVNATLETIYEIL